MIISIRFKDKNKVFRGKTYDFNLVKGARVPKQNDIVRMVDENGDYRFYGTRVRVENIRNGYHNQLDYVDTIESNLND